MLFLFFSVLGYSQEAADLSKAPVVEGWTACFGYTNPRGSSYAQFKREDLTGSDCPLDSHTRWAFWKVNDEGGKPELCGQTDEDKIGWEFWGEGAEEPLGYYLSKQKGDGRIFPSTDKRGYSSSCLFICSKHSSGGGWNTARTFKIFGDEYPFYGTIYLYYQSDPRPELKLYWEKKGNCVKKASKQCGKGDDGCTWAQYGDTFIDNRGNVKTYYKCQWLGGIPEPTMEPTSPPPGPEKKCDEFEKKWDCNSDWKCEWKQGSCTTVPTFKCKRLKAPLASKEECASSKGLTGCKLKENKKKNTWRCKGVIKVAELIG